MNNIEILEEKLKQWEPYKNVKWPTEIEKQIALENQAIENLIKENKELKKYETYYKEMEEVNKKFIPKSKIKAKIEHLEKLQENNRKDMEQALNFLNFKKLDELSIKISNNMNVRDILNQLLEEGE